MAVDFGAEDGHDFDEFMAKGFHGWIVWSVLEEGDYFDTKEPAYLRYVKSHHTSSLAAILGEYPNLGRDEGAAVVIGLRGTQEGNQWLEKRSLEIIQSSSPVALRINRKRRFGRRIMVVEGLVERQSEQKALEDSKTGVHRNQMIVGRAINDLSKALGVQWAMARCLPLCWKRSRDALSGWAVPPDSKRGVKVSEAAQLCAT
jgi:hypothetical protein